MDSVEMIPGDAIEITCIDPDGDFNVRFCDKHPGRMFWLFPKNLYNFTIGVV